MNRMGTLVFGLLLIAVFATTGCERGPEKALPQSGALVGEWKYLNTDVADEGYVRAFVIGDQTWWIPTLVRFAPDGTLHNGRVGWCHYWILNPKQLKLDCGAGQTTIAYAITGDELTLDLRGPNAMVNAGNPTIRFERFR